MDAAVLQAYGTPQFGTFDNPVKRTGTEIVEVTAAVISNLDLLMASRLAGTTDPGGFSGQSSHPGPDRGS